MKELTRAHELRVDEFSRGKLIENQILSMNPWPRYRNCKKKVHCLSGSREYKDAESVRSG